jgi:hypothetical protein
MASSAQVLLLDDGELDDVQAILDEASVSYGRVRGGAIAPHTPPPSRLLVATPRRIDVVDTPGAGEGRELMRIVVVSEDSPTLRARLREVGFDYLVRRPVHPEALRLLILRCVYTGEERRTEPRIPVGFEVSFRTGLLPRRATLADLSTRGARLVSRWPLEPGKRITLTIPEHAGIAESVTLKGRVIRMSLDERLGDAPYSAALEFEPLRPEVRRELEWILEERARGPATLGSGPGSAPPAEGREETGDAVLDPPETRAADLRRDVAVAVDVRLDVEESAPDRPPEPGDTAEIPLPELDPPPAQPPVDAPRVQVALPETPPVEVDRAEVHSAAGDEPGDRRDQDRGTYRRRVPAFGDRAMRVLVARDLSMGGMRIERESGLEIGDRLHLAIYGDAEEEPFLVWATVDRVDGEDGMYLSFDELHPMIAQQLDAVVAGLPAVESLHDDEARAMGTVVSEILNG